MVVAIIALFVALGGTGYAASQSGAPAAAVAKKKPKPSKQSDTTADKRQWFSLFNAAIGAAHVAFATTTGSATKATNAGHASTADTATTAGGAPPTGAAGGALSGSYPNPGLAGLPPVTAITSFTPGTSNYGEAGNPAGYYKDALGIVHLTGAVSYGGGSALLFTLPAGYRGEGFFAVSSGTSGTCTLEILSTGVVDTASGCATPIGLDGVTFRPLA
jgi:hypothetical protein